MTTATLKRRKIELNMAEGWSAFVFLSLALLMVTWSINEAGYSDSLQHLVLVTGGGILASLFLTKSRLPPFLAHMFSLAYGIAWNALILSLQLPSTFTAREKLLELGYRIGNWFQQAVLAGEVGTDPLMFTIVMSILFWLMTHIAIWFSFRAHNLWAALLPSGVTLVLNLYYGPDRISFVLVPYLLFVLLFIVRFNLFTQEKSWKKRQVRYDSEIVYTFLRYGATLSLITIAVAWVLPAAASSDRAEVFFSQFTEPWDQLKEEWIRLFSTLQSERVEPTYGGFGGSLALGGPVSLGNMTLMDVQSTAGRYWRAVVYDTYDGTGWTISETEDLVLDPGESPGQLVEYEGRRVITQTFTLYMPGTTQLYGLSQPQRFSLPTKISVISVNQDDGEAIDTIAQVDNRYKLDNGESYMVVSSIPMAEENAMRLAGEDYPEWVDRYLQLPDELPQRIHDLAQEITSEYDNAYDKTAALERYLRQYEYNEKIAEPPAGVDRVDYFLFDLQEGYCNYYASAMVVMARSLGIPARMAAGYARGDWESDGQFYRVRQHHSHAWPEIYFPRFGWVEFEPTASETTIVRPRSATEPQDSQIGPQDDRPYWEDYLEPEILEGGRPFDQERFQQLLAEQRRQERIRTWTRIGGILGISIAIIALAWWQGRKKMDEVKPARAYYDRMVRRGDWFGCKMRVFYTPNEYATELASSMADQESDRLVSRITNAYVGERYGNKNPGRYQPGFAWRDLRPMMTRWGIKQLWRKIWGKQR